MPRAGGPRAIRDSCGALIRPEPAAVARVQRSRALRGVVAFINWSVFGLLMLGAVVSGRQYRSACEEPSESASSPSDFLLVPSLLLIACLLPVYHRQYDAVTLLVPLCWLVMRYRERRMDGPCMLVAVALLAFYVPNVAVLIKVLVNPRLPSSIAESVWWRGSAMNLLVWSMLAMATGLLWEMARGRRRCPAQAPPDTGGGGQGIAHGPQVHP